MNAYRGNGLDIYFKGCKQVGKQHSFVKEEFGTDLGHRTGFSWARPQKGHGLSDS